MNIPPLPKYEQNLDELEKVYKDSFLKIVKQLENVDPTDLVHRDIYEAQIRQLIYIINDLSGDAKSWLEANLLMAYSDGQAHSLVTMGLANSLTEAKGVVEFALMDRPRIDAMINDTFQDVLKAHSIMEEGLKQTIREAQAEVLRGNMALQRNSLTSARDIRSTLLEEGFSRTLLEDKWKGITDAGGKRWDLTTYSKMVAKTKLQQTQLEGAKVRALDNDSDLAVISSHGAKDSCRHFEGMIVSLTGRTKGYKTVAELRNSGLIFHPNCRHNVHPIGDLDAFPQKLKDKASQVERSADKVLENRDEIMKEENARRYQDSKDKKEMRKQASRNNLAKAREKKKIERTKTSMNVPQDKAVKFDPEKTKLKKEFQKDLYEGTPLLDIPDERRDPKAVKEMFGDKMTLEGIGKAFNPDPSKYDISFKKSQIRDLGEGRYVAELDMRIMENGESIGTVNRTILKKADGSMVVHNAYFEVEKRLHGSGFSRDIYFKSEQLYKEMAKGKPINITLKANLDVGVYAWSNHGFDFKDPKMTMDLRAIIEDDLNREVIRQYRAGNVSKEDWFTRRHEVFKRELQKFGYDSLDEITHAWQFGALDNGRKYEIHTNGTQGHYGKNLLLGQSSWDGVKKLNQGHDSEVIGNLYFETRGVK